RRLLTYNEEDCAALERVVQMLRSLADGGPQSEGPGVRVAEAEEASVQSHHRFGAKTFAIPDFARITKMAYFDYQRDKVLCRTNRPVRRVKRPGRGTRGKKWKVNREVQCGIPTTCSHCGSGGFHYKRDYRKLVIDLKPVPGGLKRWVTAY